MRSVDSLSTSTLTPPPRRTADRASPLRIAAFRRGWWPEAVAAASHDCILLPALPEATCFDATLEQRIEHGRRVYQLLADGPVDLILDMYGDGMLFVDDPRTHGMDALLHHALGVPLISHWTETFRILFKEVSPELVQEALQSRTWFKGVFTRAHLAEMEWMGVPGCFYLPLAADPVDYPIEPSPVDWSGPTVLFAGSQQSRYFSHAEGVDTRTQWPGLMALAGVSDGSVTTFLDAYRRYGFGPCPAEAKSWFQRAEAVQRYYAAKQVYSATRNLATRDRFVCSLSRRMGDDFLLIGHRRWRQAYGLNPRSRVDGDTYRDLVARTPICVSMVNGDNDTGLNLRPFEITALGGFLLAYHQPELADFFEIGRECESFSNETELLDKIEYYSAHQAERDAIAQAGRARTSRDHQLHHRLTAIVSQLCQYGQLPR